MVASYTQLLERRYKGKLDSDADEFIAFAVDGAKRMQRLIDDLLTYSRVGTQTDTLKMTDSSAVLTSALTNLKTSIDESHALVTSDPLPMVPADESQLGQVFQNLIGNAIKFQNGETPQIHVGAERHNGEWVFSVRDNGIGISQEYYDRIFQIFQRLHRKEEYKGTGIGLSLCKKIILRHGGRIWLASEPGKGTTFYFTIPAEREVNQHV